MPSAPWGALGRPPPRKSPRGSVVVCALKEQRTMARCLRSLSRLAYPNFEVIIVAGGSSDSVSEVAAQFPQLRVIRQSNQGLGAARNTGVNAARGEIVAFVEP